MTSAASSSSLTHPSLLQDPFSYFWRHSKRTHVCFCLKTQTCWPLCKEKNTYVGLQRAFLLHFPFIFLFPLNSSLSLSLDSSTVYERSQLGHDRERRFGGGTKRVQLTRNALNHTTLALMYHECICSSKNANGKHPPLISIKDLTQLKKQNKQKIKSTSATSQVAFLLSLSKI